jgi:23S rRNA (uridine2552-2'-O)-methyltransferase
VSKRNQIWLERQSSDFYVKQAKEQGYRSRAAFKLLEIDQKDRLLHPGMQVIDLGAAPGGWSQVVKQKIGAKGLVISIDILSMEPLAGVQVIQGNFEDAPIQRQIKAALNQKTVKADLILSDMAPNLSGIATVDQARSIALAEAALAFVQQFLIIDGHFLVKLFQGSEVAHYLAHFKPYFKQVLIRKPKASRAESREIYLLGRGYQKKQVYATKEGDIE